MTRATPLPERIKQRATVTEAGCWVWPSLNWDGYGRLWVGSRTDRSRRLASAHVIAYETFVGPIPAGLELDHLCRNRACVNPDHLEPVTASVNIRRGDTLAAARAAQTHCKREHEFTPENTYMNRGKRYCRTCRKEYRQRLATPMAIVGPETTVPQARVELATFRLGGER